MLIPETLKRHQKLRNQKEADKQRIAANKEVLKAMKNLNRVDKSQEKRYVEFKEKLDEEKENNATFWSDLQTLEHKKNMFCKIMPARR